MSRTLQPWVAHFGFTSTPFGKNIPANNLFGRDAHAEAVARIQHCIQESALGSHTPNVTDPQGRLSGYPQLSLCRRRCPERC